MPKYQLNWFYSASLLKRDPLYFDTIPQAVDAANKMRFGRDPYEGYPESLKMVGDDGKVTTIYDTMELDAACDRLEDQLDAQESALKDQSLVASYQVCQWLADNWEAVQVPNKDGLEQLLRVWENSRLPN